MSTIHFTPAPIKGVQFIAKEQAELVDMGQTKPVSGKQIAGCTLYSLISPGTEVTGVYSGNFTRGTFPRNTGYASVFQVEQAGEEALNQGVKIGEIRFSSGNHHNYQYTDYDQTVLIPEKLSPEKAVLTRLAGVGMTTLLTTQARPGDLVAILGLGPVGYLCAQLFLISGYHVVAMDLDERRRELGRRSGIADVYSDFESMKQAGLVGKPTLAIDCTGHEKAVLDAIRLVCKRGEVVLVGVPWKKNCDATAFDITYEVFHRYVVLRSGWEHELPRLQSDFHPHSIIGGYSTIMQWLAENKFRVEGLSAIHSPQDAQQVYQNILHRRNTALFEIFDWQNFRES